jgi:membrane associated rhomboid family serine protease
MGERRRYHERRAVAALVVVNVLVYVFQLLDSGVADELALRADPGEVLDRPWTVVTVMFLHEHPMHLVLMLAVLVVAGAALEELVRARFVIAVYLAAGLAGAAAFVATSTALDLDERAVGSSAAVLGVAAALIALRPHERLVGGKATHWLAAIVVVNLLLAASAPGSSAAHLAGVAVGLAAGRLLRGAEDTGPRRPADGTRGAAATSSSGW